MQLAKNIRVLMALRGLTQSALVKKAGVNNVTLHMLVTGKDANSPTQRTLTRIAAGLGVDVVDLFRTDLVNLK